MPMNHHKCDLHVREAHLPPNPNALYDNIRHSLDNLPITTHAHTWGRFVASTHLCGTFVLECYMLKYARITSLSSTICAIKFSFRSTDCVNLNIQYEVLCVYVKCTQYTSGLYCTPIWITFVNQATIHYSNMPLECNPYRKSSSQIWGISWSNWNRKFKAKIRWNVEILIEILAKTMLHLMCHVSKSNSNIRRDSWDEFRRRVKMRPISGKVFEFHS